MTYKCLIYKDIKNLTCYYSEKTFENASALKNFIDNYL